MIEIIKNVPGITYEKNNSFTSGNHPCYYLQVKYGYIVFYVFEKGVVDLAICDKNKKQISLVIAINDSVKKEWHEAFIDNLIK